MCTTLATSHQKKTDTINRLHFPPSPSHLVTRGEIDGEDFPEEEARHVVQDQAVQWQVEGRDSRLLLLKTKQSGGKRMLK